MKIYSILFLLILSFGISGQGPFLSPDEFIKSFGHQYTPDYVVNKYLNYIEGNSDKIKIVQYGLTNEERPLQLLFISSPANLNALEDIRKTNLYNIKLSDSKPDNQLEKAIVWLSFGVHGNEAGASESVPNIVYQLLNAENKEMDTWLENTLVIIDPNLNPDGNSRYTHWIRQVTGKKLHPSHNDREHYEPWPSGRYNHYIFDLNRDWAWQTQIETQQRIAVYNQWMPHIHADFHEMGYNSNYYFAPAAEPFHKFITPFQREFQTKIGKNHAKYFDEKGLLYWTREVFDLFYPSYGDTYPTYNGAVGMTYEQAGNSRSGRSILLANDDTLTVRQKIDNNTIVALSTIEVTSKDAKSVVSNFKEYFNKSIAQPPGKYKTYIVKSDPSLSRFAGLLENAGIDFAYSTTTQKANAYHYQTQKISDFEIKPGDLIIQTKQPRSVLLQILMEESPVLQDSLTYDITAWSLPFAYGLDCYAFTSATTFNVSNAAPSTNIPVCDGNQYAYTIDWNDISAAHKISQILQRGYKVRYAVKDIKFEGKTIFRGGIIITRGDNPGKSNFDADIQSVLKNGSGWHCLQTGFSMEGGDLGGGSYKLIKAPKVMTISGPGTDPTGVGEIWHYFDNVIQYPLSIIEKNNLMNVDLSEYNVFILPGGRYRLTESESNLLMEWVKRGGKLIALEQAIDLFSAKDGFEFKKYATDEEKNEAEKADLESQLKSREFSYESFERRFISSGTAGAIIKNNVDDTHPLGYGLGKNYYSLRTSSSHYNLQKEWHNVLTVPKSYISYGFIGAGLKSKLKNTVSFAVRNSGKGQLIYMVDNPLFRGFWDKGLLLFSNAVFL